MKFLGPSEEAISLYVKEMFERKATKSGVGEISKPQLPKRAEIVSLKFFDRSWNEISFIESGQELNIVLECIMREEFNFPVFGVNFYDNSGFMYCAISNYENVILEKLPIGKIRIKINIFHFHLPTNNYLCSAIISEENIDNLIDWHDMAYRFVVGRAKNARGSIKLSTKWEIEEI